eukprot:TRINITY_DN11741_c0_g1_i1.p1 TRINITY_DN11741_c0_g1~~TRINITY_DN11741_c0_g1_i1.p1  ORF type:complete len:257 (+),score=36.45 TRINITY_DN11741_c0_g1_i1:605-1375(+)
MSDLKPNQIREQIRKGEWTKPTSGVCAGYVQANLVILPQKDAEPFIKFCELNKGPCPIVTVLPPGEKEPKEIAPGACISTDLPKYEVYENGKKIGEFTDVDKFWRSDLVSILIGCSFSFEGSLLKAGVPVRNIEQNKNVSMFITNKECTPYGSYKPKMVVSYRPIPKHLIETAKQVTLNCAICHGPPFHVGDPTKIGIADLSKPDFGDPVNMVEGDVPVFWPCGVTSKLAALQSGSDLVITHAPGHMFVSDRLELG